MTQFYDVSIDTGKGIMEKRLILLCDGDREVRNCVKSYMSGENYDVVCSGTLAGTWEFIEHRGVDLVISETELPDGDGFELCRRMRSRGSVPLIFISRKNDEPDRVMGLRMGADDFIGKPFSLRELSARAEAVLRRTAPRSPDKSLSVAELSVYPEAFSVYVAGRKVELIPSDFKLLHHLCANVGKVLSREKLLDAVWGIESTGSQRSIDTQIKRIRRAVCLPDVHFAIRSIYGVGYKLEELARN